MDVLESGNEREAVPLLSRVRQVLAVRPPGWAVGGVALAVAVALVGAGAAARDLRAERAVEAVRADVQLVPAGASSTTVAGVARGQLAVRLVNRRDLTTRLDELVVAVPGLEVLDVQPGLDQPLAAFEERELRITFVVADCRALVLPGQLSVALSAVGDGPAPVVRRQLAVVDPDVGPAAGADPGPDAVRIGACPDSARADPPGRPTDLSVRPAGGTATRTGAGAAGVVRFAVRNGGEPVQLLSLAAEVPGATFAQRRLGDGRTLVTDEVVVLRMGFQIEDCARLERTGRLVLRVERYGGVQELGLRAVAEPLAGAGPQVDLRVVLDACRAAPSA